MQAALAGLPLSTTGRGGGGDFGWWFAWWWQLAWRVREKGWRTRGSRLGRKNSLPPIRGQGTRWERVEAVGVTWARVGPASAK